MQSHNYVPGVSGWKMHSNGTLEVDGKIRAIMEDAVEKPATPFAVEGDQVILSQVIVDAGKFSLDSILRTSTNTAGQKVFNGIGVGLGCMCEGGYTGTPGEKEEKPSVKIDFTVDVSAYPAALAGKITETELGESLATKIEHEVTARAHADNQMSARIGSVSALLIRYVM
ncbi:host specificity protein J [Pseudomonas amygdali]|uniref:host specificity protein J n=1 Tax=Pseudomonas amygdali TaxID=47877 RepID=UPI003531F8CF